MSFATPLGSFLTTFDAAINSAQSTAIAGIAGGMTAILLPAAVIHIAMQGWRIMRGDIGVLNDFTAWFVKIAVIFYVAGNADIYNQYVTVWLGQTVPGWLSQAATNSAGTDTGGLSGTAASLNLMWSDMWGMVAQAYAQAGITDIGSRVIAGVASLVGGFGLLLDAGVYLISRFLLSVMLVLGPVAIGCAMFGATRGVFERWLGTAISMITLQVAAVVVMQIVINGNSSFITALQPVSAAGVASSADIGTTIQNLIGFVIWTGLGAFALYSLPAIAYSLGGGIAISFAPVIVAAGAGAAALASLPGGFGSGGGGGGDSVPELNLSMARADSLAVGGGSGSALAAPEPPALPFPPGPLLLGT